MLLGLGRGSGPRSLAGMRPVDGRCLRPLLGIRRATTRAACAAEHLPVRDDPHNADPALPPGPAAHRGAARARGRARTAASPRPWPARPSCCATTSTPSTAWPPRSAPPSPTLPVDGLAAQPRAIRTRVLRNWVGGCPLTAAQLARSTPWSPTGTARARSPCPRAVRSGVRLACCISPDRIADGRPRTGSGAQLRRRHRRGPAHRGADRDQIQELADQVVGRLRRPRAAAGRRAQGRGDRAWPTSPGR